MAGAGRSRSWLKQGPAALFLLAIACPQLRLRMAEAHLAAHNPALALGCAATVLEACGGDGDSNGAAAQASSEACVGAVKLSVQAHLGLGRRQEAAAVVCGWLEAGRCPDARACCEAIAALAAGGVAARCGEGAALLAQVAAAAARAFPGRHDPPMAVAEALLGGQVRWRRGIT